MPKIQNNNKDNLFWILRNKNDLEDLKRIYINRFKEILRKKNNNIFFCIFINFI